MSVSDSSLSRAIRGPVTLITVGVLFALNNFTPYHFRETWPVLLIVFGLLSLLGRGADGVPSSAAPGRQGFPPAPGPFGFPPPSTSSTYRQSSYTEPPPPAATAKGGFGTSAPPKSDADKPADERPGESL